MFAIRLPYPPSINHYWRTAVVRKRVMRYISKEGKAFRENVVEAVLSETGTPPQLTGRLQVSIELLPPTKRLHDIDNRIKATLDALEHAGVFADDEQIDHLVVRRLPPDPPGCVDVIVEEIDD